MHVLKYWATRFQGHHIQTSTQTKIFTRRSYHNVLTVDAWTISNQYSLLTAKYIAERGWGRGWTCLQESPQLGFACLLAQVAAILFHVLLPEELASLYRGGFGLTRGLVWAVRPRRSLLTNHAEAPPRPQRNYDLPVYEYTNSWFGRRTSLPTDSGMEYIISMCPSTNHHTLFKKQYVCASWSLYQLATFVSKRFSVGCQQ